jgi:hypothetical protein
LAGKPETLRAVRHYLILVAGQQNRLIGDSALEELLDQYAGVLRTLDSTKFSTAEDEYSGVFLPIAYDEYWSAKYKIMHVGRESSGWNTDNKKHTLGRIFRANESGTTRCIVNESVSRYRKQLETSADGKIKTKSASRFMQYFFKLSKELSIPSNAIIHANLFAWDYKKKSPRTRPEAELEAIISASIKLLAVQIQYFKPDFIVFSTGYAGIDAIIKRLFTDHLGGYKTTESVIKHKLWQFEGGQATCFRIAHPRATRGHSEYREQVIQRIKMSPKSNTN